MKMLIFLCLGLSFSHAFSQERLANIQTGILREKSNSSSIIRQNKVKTESIYACPFNNGMEDKCTCVSINSYDSLGNIVHSILEDDNKVLRFTRTYFYNPQYRLMRIVADYEYPEPHSFFTDLQYDSAGNEVVRLTYDLDSTFLDLYQSVYDSRGMQTDIFRGTNATPLRLQNKFYYSENASLTRKEVFDQKGQISNTYEYTYDSTKHINSVYQLDNYKRVLTSDETYDSKGRCIRQRGGLEISKRPDHGIDRKHNTIFDGVYIEYHYNPDNTIHEMVFYDDRTDQKIKRIKYVYSTTE